MKKCFVLDTNVIIYEPRSIFAFDDNEVVIPLVVLDEIDKHKNGDGQLAKHARMAIRSLDKLRDMGKLNDGVKTERGGTIRVELGGEDNIPSNLDASRPDNKIISVALDLMDKRKDTNVIMVSRDINVRIKCDALGINAENYTTDMVIEDLDLVYSGYTDVVVDKDDIDLVYSDGEIPVKNITRPLYPNEYIHLKSNVDEKHSALTRFNGTSFVKVKTYKNTWGLSSRNREQTFALDALFDPDIKLVTITGIAGVGKTLVAALAGVSQALDSGLYERMILTRPIVPLGNDLGFLPGPQPLSAKISTPDGWVTMGDLKCGDIISAGDGSPTKVIGVFPKGKKSVYRITTTDGTTTECCSDHLWYTYTKENIKRKKQGSVRTTMDIIKTIVDKNGKLNHYLPRNGPVEMSKRALPISPYTMGALLGDGSLRGSVSFCNTDEDILERVNSELLDIGMKLVKPSSGITYNIASKDKLYNNKVSRKIKITDIDKDTSEVYSSIGIASSELMISKTSLNTLCMNKKTQDGKLYQFIDSGIRWNNVVKNCMYDLNLLNTKANSKFIPSIYKYSSIDDRVNLLRGLMDTDGTIKKNGEASFCTISAKLANDIVEVVRSLGGRASIRLRDRSGKVSKIVENKNERYIKSNYDIYEFTISMPKNINPFYTKRKANRHDCKYIYKARIQSIEKVGEKEVQCILVDNDEHLYITDDFIVTHNTMEEKFKPWLGPIMDNLSLIFSHKGRYMLESYMDEGVIDISPLVYIRGRSLSNSYIILDEGQNTSRHEIKTLVTRAGEGTKVIIVGDVDQIDTPGNPYDNGLSYVIEKFKDDPISAHIHLINGERSELATLAAEKL